MRVFIYIDKSWTNKEWNESVPKHRMICWSKIAIYIYLWLMGLSIGTWINFQNVCAYIILSAFFPYNTLVPHFTEAETGGKICFLLLSSALNMFNIWVLPAFGSFNYCVYWFFVVGVFFQIRLILVQLYMIQLFWEQAEINKKESFTATDTVTVVKGIPCAYQ